MRRGHAIHTEFPLLPILGLAWSAAFVSAAPAWSQTLPPELEAQLIHVVADRVETLTVLGGYDGISGGLYFFGGDGSKQIDLTKAGGGGTLGNPRAIGDGSLRWAPILQGGFGYISSTNTFEQSVIAGNVNRYETIGVNLGGGARLYLNDWLSLAGQFGLMYGRTRNLFTEVDAAGAALKQALSGTLFDWTLNSISIAPEADVTFEFELHRVGFELVSRYGFIDSWSFGETTPVISATGTSDVWVNYIDTDVPLGVSIFGRELHTGGFYSRAQLFGRIEDGLGSDHINSAHARLVLDTLGWIPLTKWLGVGGSYFWGANFDGWSVGIDIRMKLQQ